MIAAKRRISLSVFAIPFSFGIIRGDFAAAENGDEGFGAPVNEPAGKSEYRSNLYRCPQHFREPFG